MSEHNGPSLKFIVVFIILRNNRKCHSGWPEADGVKLWSEEHLLWCTRRPTTVWTRGTFFRFSDFSISGFYIKTDSKQKLHRGFLCQVLILSGTWDGAHTFSGRIPGIPPIPGSLLPSPPYLIGHASLPRRRSNNWCSEREPLNGKARLLHFSFIVVSFISYFSVIVSYQCIVLVTPYCLLFKR